MGQGKSSCFECFETPDFIISIKTGDTKGAGLHNSVYITLVNEEGIRSREIHLNGCCMTVFKKGRIDEFNVARVPGFGHVKQIIIQQHEEQGDVDWYLDKVTVRHIFDDGHHKAAVFPVHRWMKPDKPVTINEFDSTLPQLDDNATQRKTELSIKQITYAYHKTRGLPLQIRMLPRDETYSNFHKFDIKEKKAQFFARYGHVMDAPVSWNSLEEMESLFKEKGKLPRPSSLDDWQSDIHFGKQRLIGCNPKSIQLCLELPENFAACSHDIEPFLEGKTLSDAFEQKKLFIVDHKILDSINDVQNNHLTPSPIALFYLNDEDELLPIAIQLYQKKSDSNPVFHPSDPETTWLAAKTWFNCADAAFQRCCLHIAGTHAVLEMIVVSVNRQLSPSHPVFRLLGPYLKYVLSINQYELNYLIAPGGWLDSVSNVGANGAMELIRRHIEEWRMDVDGCFPKYLEKQGVLDADVLPDYPYRDDGMLLYSVIHAYVKSIVQGNYDTPEKLKDDFEIQNWAEELTSEDGCHMKGVPGDGKFNSTEDLAQLLTSIIFISTVEHAAFNLPLYDECSFIPNYPMSLRGSPPNSKAKLSDEHVVDAMPLKHTTIQIIAVNKLLSERETSGLADTKSQYQYDPIALAAKHRFMGSLREVATTINLRNQKRKCHYDYLNPGVAVAQSR